MILSIIIPVYNGAATIGRCLDSIYSQGLSQKDFEVICVDDCSPDPSSVKTIEEYQYKSAPPSNLKLIRHTINKRQGGARNTGIRAAQGKWILFIDQDDVFIEETIIKILQVANKDENLDTIMFDNVDKDENGNLSKSNFIPMNLDTKAMTGLQFLSTIPVPWCPWLYLYKREHLLKENILFAENVRFEDADFVLKYTARSKSIRFYPLIVICHINHKEQTTQIGNDENRISDFFRMSMRTYEAAINEKLNNITAGNLIMGHAIYMRSSALKRYLWRVPTKKMISILQECRFCGNTNNTIIDITNNHIVATALLLTTIKPLLFIISHIRRIVKT